MNDFPWQPLTTEELEKRYEQLEQRAKVPIQPEYLTDIYGPGRWAFITTFMHRDGRFWRGRVTRLVPDEELSHYSQNYLVSITATGCRPIRFTTTTVPVAKQLIERFANLPLRLYARWVADAEDTYDFNNQGEIFQISYDDGPVNVIQQVRKTGPYQLTILPDEHELDAIRGAISVPGASLVYAHEEVIPPGGFRPIEITSMAALVDLVGEPIPDFARRRNRQRLLEAQSSELFMPRAREERAIQL